MTLFQIITLTLIAAALLREVYVLLRGKARWPGWPLRVTTWLATGVAIYEPNLVQAFAMAIGIGRGADVVLYLFVLVFISAAFYFYSCQVSLERRLTELLRDQAIKNATRGPVSNPAALAEASRSQGEA